jgi:hypothetical protein
MVRRLENATAIKCSICRRVDNVQLQERHVSMHSIVNISLREAGTKHDTDLERTGNPYEVNQTVPRC